MQHDHNIIPEVIYEYEHLKSNTMLRLSYTHMYSAYNYIFEYKPKNSNEFTVFRKYVGRGYCPRIVFKHMNNAIKALDKLDIINIKEAEQSKMFPKVTYLTTDVELGYPIYKNKM